jgi:hypothetical protein
MGLSMEFGITDTFAVGVVAYGVCALMVVELARRPAALQAVTGAR